jgi:hypothetical protein
MTPDKFRYIEGGGGEEADAERQKLTPEERERREEEEAYIDELRKELKIQEVDLARLRENWAENQGAIKETEVIIAEIKEQLQLSEGE